MQMHYPKLAIFLKILLGCVFGSGFLVGLIGPFFLDIAPPHFAVSFENIVHLMIALPLICFGLALVIAVIDKKFRAAFFAPYPCGCHPWRYDPSQSATEEISPYSLKNPHRRAKHYTL
jgi:hypothetical protein